MKNLMDTRTKNKLQLTYYIFQGIALAIILEILPKGNGDLLNFLIILSVSVSLSLIFYLIRKVFKL